MQKNFLEVKKAQNIKNDFFFGTAKIVQTVFRDRTKWMLAAKKHEK